MPARSEGSNNSQKERRRNPSRPKKGTVSDIKEAFKKMEEPENSNKKANTKARKSQDLALKPTTRSESQMNTINEHQESEENLNSNSEADNQNNQHDQEQGENNSIDQENYELTQDSQESQDSQDSQVSQDESEAEDKSEDEQEVTVKASEVKANDCDCAGASRGQENNDQVREALNEIRASLKNMENALFDPKHGLEIKLAKTIQKVQDIQDDINGAAAGLKTRMDKLEKESLSQQTKINQIETTLTRVTKMLDDNKKVAKQLVIMQGMLQKFAQQGQATNAKVQDLTKRGMEQNLVIYGIDEQDPRSKHKENCREATISFLRNFLEIEVLPQDIWKVHRLGGQQRPGYVRPMVIKVAYHVKELIMENVGKLKDQINSTSEKPLFISEQLPEGVAEARRQKGARLKVLRDENAALSDANKKTIQVQSDKILVNGVLDEPDVKPPQPSDLFISADKQKQVDIMYGKTVMTEPIEVKNSSFVGLAVETNTIKEVNLAYTAVAQQFPSMDHIMVAYALKENGVVKHGHCDDFEHGGGSAIRKVMAEEKARNTTIFVIRGYGGLHLGLDRFKAIKQVAKNALFLLRQKP